MALIDDVISFVIIVLIILIGAIFITNKTITRGVDTIKEKSNEFTEQSYSTTLNTFMNVDEKATGLPHNILLGNYMSDGKRVYQVKNATFDLKLALEQELDKLYGSGMYYSRIHRQINSLFVTFVFDGSDSLQDERIEIGLKLDYIEKGINEFFGDQDIKINSQIYILSEKSTSQMCSVFSPEQQVNCEALSFNKTYSNGVAKAPTFGFPTFKDWLNSDPYVKNNLGLFAEGDWIAGIAYANNKYMEYATSQNIENSLHIIIPIDDELSTSSVSDTCFKIKNEAKSLTDYTACALCDDKCPVERSNTYLKPVTNLMVNSSTVVIPVYSFSCSFKYNPIWNQFTQTDFNKVYAKLPTTYGSICEDPKCKGCDPDPKGNLSAFCFHTNCQDFITTQMSYIANATFGELVDITDASQLPERIIEKINKSLQKFSFEIGILDTERTRYVFEREVLLPSYAKGKFNLWVYTELFEDKEKPVIFNVTVFPSKGHNGTIFKITSFVVDNSSVDVTAEIPLWNSSTARIRLEEVEEAKYVGYLNSSGFEEGDYFISIEAVDARGNLARLDNGAKFQINDSDEIPPEILGLGFDPKIVLKSDGWENIWANVTDNSGIQSVQFIVTYPDGQIRTLDAILVSGMSYSASLTGLTLEGDYQVTAEAYDFSANKATKSGSFKVVGRRFRIIFAPVGFSTSTSVTNFIKDTIVPYLAGKYPTKDCQKPVDRFQAVIIDPDLCKDLICSYEDCSGCYGCFDVADTCYSRYKSSTGDNEPFILVLGIVPGASCGGYRGCAGLSDPYSFSVQEDFVVAHESGHSMGLCHVGPTGGSCDSPAGIDEDYCPNKNEIETEECMMNYCDTTVKNFCPKGFAYLKNQMKAPVNYLEGC